jgi:DNA-binding NtrC family response regulator
MRRLPARRWSPCTATTAICVHWKSHYRGRMTEVARRLGIGRSTLYRKLGELGIDTAA